MANFRPKKPLGGTKPPDTDTFEAFLRIALKDLVISTDEAETDRQDTSRPGQARD